jgi:hypothetical protein
MTQEADRSGDPDSGRRPVSAGEGGTAEMYEPDDLLYHQERARAELDLAYRAGSRAAAAAHLLLSSLHMRRLEALRARGSFAALAGVRDRPPPVEPPPIEAIAAPTDEAGRE